MHGIRVTLQPPDGAEYTEDAILTLATGPNNGQLYSGSGGFWVEVVGDPGGTHSIAGFGWTDGERGHTITEVVPVLID